MRPALERLLQRQGIEYELRNFSEKSLCYAVRLPLNRTTDRVSSAIDHLAGDQVPSVKWEERKVK
jgi:hypothetical protein